jgi:predicted NAD/FAD-dependent oxidoreductase
VALDGDRFQRFDAVVCAVPARQSLDVLPLEIVESKIGERLRAVQSAPIVNLHAWFDRPVAEFPFAAFTGNELQWVFNRDRLDVRPRSSPGMHHIVVSLSAAAEYMPLTKRELEERFVPQIRAALPAARSAALVRFQAIKEPEATFVPAPGLERAGPETPVAGLVLAGAHTATGWPATMESAVRSGRSASMALAVDFQTSELALHTGGR